MKAKNSNTSEMISKINIVIFLTIVAVLLVFAAKAQTTYTVSSNTNWSAKLPATCANCTINISSAVTLTIDEAVTCQNCVIKGGSLTMTNQTLNIQYAGSLTTTTFTGVAFNIYGANGKVVVNAPLSMSNSIFTFYNTSYFNTSYQVDLVSSRINLYDSSNMYATGGSSTGINLSSSSQIVIGNGSQTSTAMLTVSGPTVTVYDQSTIAVGNENNVYYNWASYNALPNMNANSNATKTYSTSSSTMNCGSTHLHSCSNPAMYGPATLSKAGTVAGSTLPVVLLGFSAVMNDNKTVGLKWNTMIEENASHFEIERSADGRNWSPIGNVNAVGNSAVESDYAFIDQSPAAGVNYYRLKMVDLDGRYGYSTINVLRGGLVSNISFFPNPARDYVNVGLGNASAGKVTVRLISQSGQVLQEKNADAGNGAVVSFPLQQLSSGWYILSVTAADGSRESSKLVVSRS